MHDFIERWEAEKSELADALLEMIANQEESLTRVWESEVIAEWGDVLSAEGCVHGQKRRMSEELAEAQRIAAEKIARGVRTIRPAPHQLHQLETPRHLRRNIFPLLGLETKKDGRRRT